MLPTHFWILGTIPRGHETATARSQSVIKYDKNTPISGISLTRPEFFGISLLFFRPKAPAADKEVHAEPEKPALAGGEFRQNYLLPVQLIGDRQSCPEVAIFPRIPIFTKTPAVSLGGKGYQRNSAPSVCLGKPRRDLPLGKENCYFRIMPLTFGTNAQ